MKRTSLLVFLLGAGIVAWTMPVQPVSTSPLRPHQSQFQQPPGSQDPLISTVANQDQSQERPPTREFTGRIISLQGVCVLKDSHSRVLYQLDDQQEAHSYQGKTVTVTGMLESASQTILVESIRPVRPMKWNKTTGRKQ